MLRTLLLLLILLTPAAFAADNPVSGSTDQQMAGDAGKGETVFKVRGCKICHSLNGKGGAVGPELTQVTQRRSHEWLVKWLNNPPSVLKLTDMPKFDWRSDSDVVDVIAYLGTFRKPVSTDFLGHLSEKEAGEKLVDVYACKACHTIVDPDSGRVRYPDLTHVGSRFDQAGLVNWLKDPQAQRPGTFMPTYDLSDKELSALSEYLSSLK